ncbi:DNA-primase RepB domain-containing protein [Catalinimonas sp. 4WD22]|uniref:DNA-primase RepB domain-containing protein n=1 Tax=Catalinimonas locisalis TaxID=3133978 RepID=UPI003101755B
MKNDLTHRAVDTYLKMMPCKEYRVQMVYFDDLKREEKGKKPQKRIWSGPQVFKSIDFLKSLNAQGFHIYARPLSMRYIFIDDISKDQLASVRQIKPVIIMESSPDNYQAFLKLKETPKSREEALHICRFIAERFNADLGSADPDHLGRLPNFANRKPKYQSEGGLFPFVKLQYAFNQISNISPPSGGLCSNDHFPAAKRIPQKSFADRSREDFAITCQMLKRGCSDQEIYETLILRDKAVEKRKHGPKYVWTTIKNAKKRLNLNSLNL